MPNVVPLLHWRYPADPEDRYAIKAAMLNTLKLIGSNNVSPTMLGHIANEYMHGDSGIVWPLWQELATHDNTPEWVLLQLYEKKLWYLDILLVQHPSFPQRLVEAMVHLPIDIRAAHSTYKGYDRNRELRAQARKRLGMPLEEEKDDE